MSQLFGNKSLGNLKIESQVDKVNIVRQLSTYIYDRQNSLRSLAGALKNLQEGLTINAPTSGSQKSGDAVLFPYQNRKTQIPSVLSHMIEYEEDDDLGPGSGKRFVVRGGQYNNLTISEEEPPYTMVTVNGLFGEGFTEPPGSMNLGNGGNAVSTAFAVDYDMWYMYGFKVSQAIQAPFFSDPDSQCAPYAVSNLVKNRKNIFQGSLSIKAYNEYYQPGDVIYLEDRDTLFYVQQVQHDFTEKSLKSTLTLKYGHSPGEYIPNMLDIIGKVIYNSKGFAGQFRHDKYNTVGALKSLGCIQWKKSTDDLISDIRNKAVIDKALFSSTGKLTNSSITGNNGIIIRIYFDATDLNHIVRMTDSAIFLRNYLLNKIGKPSSSDAVSIERVDLSANEYTRIKPDNVSNSFPNDQNPSSSAWYIAKASSTSLKNNDPVGLSDSLNNYAIDIFIGTRSISQERPISTTKANLFLENNSQASQQSVSDIKKNTGVILDPVNDNPSSASSSNGVG
jgi:hypothetical protein